MYFIYLEILREELEYYLKVSLRKSINFPALNEVEQYSRQNWIENNIR